MSLHHIMVMKLLVALSEAFFMEKYKDIAGGLR